MMKTSRFATLLIVAAASVLLAACATTFRPTRSAQGSLPPAGSTDAEDPPPVLNDLKSIEELREPFIRDVGKTRLVLLLSPT